MNEAVSIYFDNPMLLPIIVLLGIDLGILVGLIILNKRK